MTYELSSIDNLFAMLHSKKSKTICILTIMTNQMTTVSEEISDEELFDVLRRAGEHRGGKSAKYSKLERHRATIIKMMQNNAPLTFILIFLKEKHAEELVLNTLRKYVITYLGREVYDEYLRRNFWQKTRRKPPLANAAPDIPMTKHGTSKDGAAPPALESEANQTPAPGKVLTASEMKEGLRTPSLDPSEFD